MTSSFVGYGIGVAGQAWGVKCGWSRSAVFGASVRRCLRTLVLAISSLCVIAQPLASQSPSGGPLPKVTGVVVLSIRRDGILPAETTIKSGRILFRIANRVGYGQLDLELSRQAGQDGHYVKPVQMPPGKWSRTELLMLEPGRYIVRVSGYPKLSAVINVTAK